MKKLTNQEVADKLRHMKGLSYRAQRIIEGTEISAFVELFGDLKTAEEVNQYVIDAFKGDRAVYVSDEAIREKGVNYFVNLTTDDYRDAPYGGFMEDDGLLVSMDDMGDVYVQLTEEDVAFTDVWDLEEETLDSILLRASKSYNMAVICEYAGVSYGSFRNWKNTGSSFSDEKKLRLLDAMKRVANNIRPDLL